MTDNKLFHRMTAWAKTMFGKLFGRNRNSGFKNTQDPHKRRTRRKDHGRRRFEFRGVDGNIHLARVGKPFKVRPAGLPNVFIATWGNRGFIEVKS